MLLLFLVWPNYQMFSSLQIEIERRDIELQYIEENFKKLKATSERLKSYESALEKVESALPVDPSIPSFLSFLQRASNSSGLFVKEFGTFTIRTPRVTTGNVTDSETISIKTISLPIQLAGSYPAFKNFLTTLENNAKIFEIQSLSFSSSQEGIFSFEINVETYSY